MTVKEIMEQAKDGSISWEDIKKREGLDTEMEKLEKMVRKLEDDTISRQATITEIKNYERDSTAPIDYVHIVEQMPPAHPERKRGYWIPQDFNKKHGNASTAVYYFPKCSECGAVGNENYLYCPMCGCLMER